MDCHCFAYFKDECLCDPDDCKVCGCGPEACACEESV